MQLIRKLWANPVVPMIVITFGCVTLGVMVF